MIILDTNVVSEMMEPSPAPSVKVWLNAKDGFQFYMTTITIAEIAYGIHKLPLGKRRSFIESTFEEKVLNMFDDRVFSFDKPAARLYGEIMNKRKKIGRPMGTLDAQIAAIALANDASLATRNTRDFEHCGLNLINPFLHVIS